ncbi:MAG: 1-acyl-sn-glycerol-3-phosphate acyltransferase [Bradymonadia bacterium]
MISPLFQFNEQLEDISREVVNRSTQTLGRAWGSTAQDSFRLVLNDAALHEVNRLGRKGEGSNKYLEEWQRLARRIGRLDEHELRREIEKRVSYYTRDIAGYFDRRVYSFATRVVPFGLSALFNTTDLAQGFRQVRHLADRIQIQGPMSHLADLARMGTLIIMPTHSSNLDSIVMGWSFTHARLPPCVYGAGKNLFTNPLIGYFMKNLGAYRVDRRLGHVLYKDVLKCYSQVLIERGYHSLFFPGGTRSRSGCVESKLKLGLLGSAQMAFSERVQRGDDRPIFLVPVTINYPLVLEGETLVEDYLKDEGQARYIIDDDEFSRFGRIFQYATKVMGLDTSMVLRFGEPLDVFGNRVDKFGHSIGPSGHRLNPAEYLFRDGVYVPDPDRDSELTRQAGEAVVEAYRRNTVVLPTNFLGFLLLERERALSPQRDLFALLRTCGGERHSKVDVGNQALKLRAKLMSLETQGALVLSEAVREQSIEGLLEEAVTSLSSYHLRPTVEQDEKGFYLRDPKMAFYYGNRLEPWAPELREAMA